MSKRSFDVLPIASPGLAEPAAPYLSYLTHRRGWGAALVLCWALGLLVITVPEGSPRGGAGVPGPASAQASLTLKFLPNPELSLDQQALDVEPVITHSREMPTGVVAMAASHSPLSQPSSEPLAAVAGESEQSGYSLAVQSFREGRYAAAFGRFTQLADAGHKASAESALFMLRHGQELFGAAWSASEDEQLLWETLVAQGSNALQDNPAGD